MTAYDIILAGGGAAGLSLAYHLACSPLRDCSVLIVDCASKERNDRTFCFWTDQPTLYDEIVYRSWNRLRFVGEDFERVAGLGAFRYQMIRGLDFYRTIQRELSASGRVEFLRGRVEDIQDGPDQAAVLVDGRRYHAAWVFDSRFNPARFRPYPGRYHWLRQHFKGWLIETAGPAFDPTVATFLDFRTPQENEMRFFYLLPLSERRALVEYVRLTHGDYGQALRGYLEDALGITNYRILATEAGTSPLTDRPFPRQTGQRVMTIGTPGGQVKPTSGYAFTRIQADSAAIVHSLLQAGHPFDVAAPPRLYRLCDSLMLHIMDHRGDQIKPIFTTMFRNNPIQRIFRFLDETTSLRENLALIASLPPSGFLAAWFQLQVLRQV
jgi:lycopene beta-cyclase